MARKQEHPIQLSDVERTELEAIASKGRQKARIIRRAQTLLWSDAGKPDSEIAQWHGVTPLTVAKTRQRRRILIPHQLQDVGRVSGI